MDEGSFVSLGEAAQRLGVEVEAIFDLVLSRQIPTMLRPNGRPLVDPADVARILEIKPGAGTPT